MLVFAAPRPEGSEELLLEDLNESRLTATITEMSGDSLLTNTLQLTSARMRRRERVNSELFRVAILVSGNKKPLFKLKSQHKPSMLPKISVSFECVKRRMIAALVPKQVQVKDKYSSDFTFLFPRRRLKLLL